MDREEVAINRNAKTNDRGQYPTMLTEQDWTLKDLLCGQEEEEAKLPLRNRNKRGKSQASKMGPHFPLR